jgi:membrane protease YdiL (CAAX protease family)
MDLQQVFTNQAGRLRSGWRVAVFALIYIAFQFLIIGVVPIFYALASLIAPNLRPGPYFENVLFRLILLVAALVVGYLCTHWLEGLPWRAMGLSLHARWLRDFLVGSLIGVVSLALATGIATAAGGLRFRTPDTGLLLQTGQTLVFSAALFVIAALAEEALFRGYPLQTLTRAGLAWLGVLLTAVPFAAVHLRNPNVVRGFTFVNTALAGVWFAVAYLRTRSLWFPLGIHWSWNWALGSLFGLPVSGLTNIAPHPLLHGIDLGPAWLTGGNYGIEGGVACTITLVISTIFVWRTRLVSATEELKKLTSQENPVGEKRLISILREDRSAVD